MAGFDINSLMAGLGGAGGAGGFDFASLMSNPVRNKAA